MARIRQIIESIRQHLGQLAPTHKMLIGSAIIIMAMATFLVVQYSGNARTVSLRVDEGQKVAAFTTLRSADIPVARDDRGEITVPTAFEQDALALLTSNQTMSGSSLFEMIQKQAWWANRQQNRNLMDAALGQYLSQLISRWPAVREAQVLIRSPSPRQTLGQRQEEPTASVQILPKGTELTVQQARAIAEFIAGTTPGLAASAVNVSDVRNGRRIRIPGEDDQTANKYLEQQARIEKHYEGKIADALAIPGAIVMVSAQIDVSPETENVRRVLPEGDGTVVAPVDQMKSSSKSSGGSGSGGQPGATANTGMTATSLSRQSQSPTLDESESQSTNEVIPGESSVTKVDPKGYALKVNATINIPRSHFTRIWQLQNPDATEAPNDPDLAEVITNTKSQIEQMAQAHIDTEIHQRNQADDATDIKNGDVIVGMYYDFEQDLSLGDLDRAQVGGSFVSFGNLQLPVSVRSLGLGALALLSLFMMFRLIKGGVTSRQMPTAEELIGIPPSLGGESAELIGEADQADPAMEALELDEDEIRAQKIAEQVDEMVMSSPKEAARLVTRWIEIEE